MNKGPVEMSKELADIRTKLKYEKHLSTAQLRCYRLSRKTLIDELKKYPTINPKSYEQNNQYPTAPHR